VAIGNMRGGCVSVLYRLAWRMSSEGQKERSSLVLWVRVLLKGPGQLTTRLVPLHTHI
jgi:hypothetical protein